MNIGIVDVNFFPTQLHFVKRIVEMRDKQREKEAIRCSRKWSKVMQINIPLLLD